MIAEKRIGQLAAFKALQMRRSETVATEEAKPRASLAFEEASINYQLSTISFSI
jgi:hypothetical protein